MIYKNTETSAPLLSSLLRAAVDAIEMQVLAGINPLCRINGNLFPISKYHLDTEDDWEFPIAVLDNKPVFAGDTLHAINAENGNTYPIEVERVDTCRSDVVISIDGYAYALDRLSWDCSVKREKVKLSERVRAGSEAAPWVVEEICKLEKELDSRNPATQAAIASRDEEIEQLNAKIAMQFLDAEERGFIINGLILERERSLKRKEANSESNSDYSADECAKLIKYFTEYAIDQEEVNAWKCEVEKKAIDECAEFVPHLDDNSRAEIRAFAIERRAK